MQIKIERPRAITSATLQDIAALPFGRPVHCHLNMRDVDTEAERLCDCTQGSEGVVRCPTPAPASHIDPWIRQRGLMRDPSFASRPSASVTSVMSGRRLETSQ